MAGLPSRQDERIAPTGRTRYEYRLRLLLEATITRQFIIRKRIVAMIGISEIRRTYDNPITSSSRSSGSR